MKLPMIHSCSALTQMVRSPTCHRRRLDFSGLWSAPRRVQAVHSRSRARPPQAFARRRWCAVSSRCNRAAYAGEFDGEEISRRRSQASAHGRTIPRVGMVGTALDEAGAFGRNAGCHARPAIEASGCGLRDCLLLALAGLGQRPSLC